jgi:uncharacterized phiE125 gp8 family phage protein
MPILYGSSRARRFVRDCIDGADGVDLLWVGDSNTGYNGYGWCDGFAGGLTRAGARMYATSAYTAGNEYGTAGYRSQQWTYMGWGSPTGYYPLSTSTSATTTLKMTMGKGGGSLTIDTSAFEGGALEASNNIQNEWAIWMFARGYDGQFTEPCPIGLDNQLVWRGQVNIASGGHLHAHWLTLANVQLHPKQTFNTVSALTTAWDTIEYTLPAGSRLSGMTAAATGVKVALAGSGVGASNQLTGPIRFGLHSVYTARKGYSSSIFEWRGSATLSNIFTDVTNAASAASSLDNMLRYLRERQIAAGGSGRVVFCLQGGVNSGDWSPSNAALVVGRVNSTLEAVRKVWTNAGYGSDDLAFMVMCSHPTNASDAALSALRSAMRDEYANSSDVLFVDLNEVADYTRITEEGWYDSLGNEHLEELRGGYEAIASAVVAEMASSVPSPFLTVAQVKTALRIDYTEDDDEFQRLLDAAVAWVERYTGLKLSEETRTLRLKSYARNRLGNYPVAQVDSVTYVSGGTTVTMPADDYWLDTTEAIAAIEFLEEPQRDEGTMITVTYRSGYDGVPKEIVQAVIGIVGHWYNNPEAAQPIGLTEVPLGTRFLLDHLRVEGPFS